MELISYISIRKKVYPISISGDLEGFSVLLEASYPLTQSSASYVWYRNGVVVQESDTNTLTVIESGTYKVSVYAPYFGTSQEVNVNIYDGIFGYIDDGNWDVHGAFIKVFHNQQIVLEGLSDKNGIYGIPVQNSYQGATVEITHPAYETKQIENVNLVSGSDLELNTSLVKKPSRFQGFKQYHIVFDDTIRCFRQITENQNSISSIFETPIFGFLKSLNDNFGTVCDLAIFLYEESSNFYLSETPDTFKQEFQDNKHWLRIGYHAYSQSEKYGAGQPRDLITDYREARDEIERIAGLGVWLPNTYIGHHYKARAHEMADLAAEGVKFIDASPYEMPTRLAYQYNTAQMNEWKTKGYYYDSEHDFIVCSRTSIERRLGKWADSGGLPPDEIYSSMETYFDEFINPVPGFYHIETHEQRLFDLSSIYAKGIYDTAKWMYENGFTPKFKDEADWIFGQLE